METKGRFLNWRFSPLEMIASAVSLATMCVGITLWSVSTFQSKADAADVKVELSRRIDAVEKNYDTIRTSVDQIRSDTSYIRGRLEHGK